jgi:CrcB protein
MGLMTPADSCAARREAIDATESLAARQGFFVDGHSYRLHRLTRESKMLKWSLIAVGGAFGSLLRYAIQGWVQRLTDSAFPIGTLVVNATACLAIGFLSGLFASPQLIREEYRIGLTVGVLGGYSTFSTFGLESFNLANDGEFALAALNMVLSCAVGLAAVWLGYRVAEFWFGV